VTSTGSRPGRRPSPPRVVAALGVPLPHPRVRKLAKTVRANRDRILAAIELGLSNSKLEGINSKIRLINHRGYGHHSAAALIAMIYLRCGGITVQLPTERVRNPPFTRSGAVRIHASRQWVGLALVRSCGPSDRQVAGCERWKPVRSGAAMPGWALPYSFCGTPGCACESLDVGTVALALRWVTVGRSWRP